MNRITLAQLIEMLQSLPQQTKDKPLDYLDLAHLSEADLEELKDNLIKSGDTIQVCQN